MNQFSLLLSAALTVIAGVHFLWAAGGVWPLSTAGSIGGTISSTRGVDRMPARWTSAAIGGVLLFAALWALFLRQVLPISPPRLVILIGGLALAYVFVLRGILGIMPSFDRRTIDQPFVRLNRLVYSPMCLMIGAAFILLVVAWPNWTWRISLIF